MAHPTSYPAGVPCWTDTLQPDPQAALRFYTELFGWQTDGPGPMAGGGEYHVARVGGHDVAGIGSNPGGPATWNTYISVDDLDTTIRAVTDAGGTHMDGPLDASPAGRLAVVADPSGAAFGLWQPDLRQGAQLVNAPAAWTMSALHSPDPDGAAAFYHAVFGWTTEPLGDAIMFRLPGYVGGEPQQPVSREVVAVMLPLRQEGVPAHWSVDFWVLDPEAIARDAARLGGRLLAGLFETPTGVGAVLADPQGAIFTVSTASHQ